MKKFIDDKWEILPNIHQPSSSSNALEKFIYANARFAEKRYKNQFTWIPSPSFEKEIFDKVFE